MAAWLTVYCSKPCTLGAEDVKRELDAADLETLSENHDIDAALANAATPRFVSPSAPLGDAELFWKPEDHRPLVFHHWREPANVAEEIAEAREEAIPEDVHLDEVVEIVAIEMGFSAYEDMGIVLAWEVARIVARACGGFVRDDENNWSLVGPKGGWRHLS